MVGCEKKNENDYAFDQIFGKWEWIMSHHSGFTSPNTYPQNNQKDVLEFKLDSTLVVKENGNIVYQSTVKLKNDTLIFFDINKVELVNRYEIKNATLILTNTSYPFSITYPVFSYYKRIN